MTRTDSAPTISQILPVAPWTPSRKESQALSDEKKIRKCKGWVRKKGWPRFWPEGKQTEKLAPKLPCWLHVVTYRDPPVACFHGFGRAPVVRENFKQECSSSLPLPETTRYFSHDYDYTRPIIPADNRYLRRKIESLKQNEFNVTNSNSDRNRIISHNWTAGTTKWDRLDWIIVTDKLLVLSYWNRLEFKILRWHYVTAIKSRWNWNN